MDKENNGLDTMLERGEIVLNGHKFTVKPIYLGEESDYIEDVKYALYPTVQEGQELTQKELSKYVITLFIHSENEKYKKQGIIGKLKIWFFKNFTRNYRYYSDNQGLLNVVKWIERKVYYKKKPIKFYDLERKYGLNKSEIVELFRFFQESSGF